MPATPNEALLDVNLLIAALLVDHGSHGKAKDFVEGLDCFYTTRTTQGGLLRFAPGRFAIRVRGNSRRDSP